MLTASRSVRNVLWNLMGGLVAGVLVVVATPIYVRRLGLEGYGIVGLWLMMQVMMGLLDAGMGATLVKEFADVQNDAQGVARKRDLLRTLECLYWALALLLGVGVAMAAGPIAGHWLQARHLAPGTVAQAIRLMALALALQFPTALYANGLAGLQEHGRMNALQVAASALRYGCGVVVLLWRADLLWFFAVQALVAGAQTFATRSFLWARITPGTTRPPRFDPALLRRVGRFSLGMAATAFSGVLMANADRIVLSRMLPTEELGKYAVAFTATGLLQMGIQPFYRAFFPRYAELVSAKDAAGLRHEYFRSCRFLAAVLLPIGIIGWLFAPNLFHAWLGRHDPTIVVVFRWLLTAITCSGLMWLPAAFMQAHGRPGLHAGMVAGALGLGVPAMILAIRLYGTPGATAVWLLHGLSGLTLELWLMHRRLLVGELLRWYRQVVAAPFLFALPLALVSSWLLPQGLSRLADLAWIGLTGAAVLAVTLAFTLRRNRWPLQPVPVSPEDA